jgi:acetoin utilization protein AcuB
MLVKNWMTTEVVTIKPDDSMMKASKLLKDNDIHRLPVVDDDGKLVGVISHHDIKEASPSKATTLDVHELYYLLSEIKVKDIMTKSPITILAEESVEKAAVLLNENDIGGLPVVDDASKVVGVLSDSDIFGVFAEITRVKDGGVQIGFKMPRTAGEVKHILDDLAAAQCRILSVITVYPPGEDFRFAYVRIADMDKSDLNTLRDNLQKKYEVIYFIRDNLQSIR